MSMDNREKLESDALALVDNLRVYGFNYAGDAEVEIIGMLDRQASITRAELESSECRIEGDGSGRVSEYIVRAPEWAIDKNGNSLYQGCEEVIRCRNCKHFKTRNGLGLCKRWKYFSIRSQPDDFCSRAERQDE